jgi:hypothetical protein
LVPDFRHQKAAIMTGPRPAGPSALRRAAGAATGGRSLTDNVKDYRFVMD